MGPSLATDLALPAELTREFLLYHRVCPIRVSADGALVVAVAPNAFTSAIHDIHLAYRRSVTQEEHTAAEVERLIERLTTRADRLIQLDRDGEADDDRLVDVRSLAEQPPVVRYLNLLLGDAYEAGASDVHLEAAPDGLSARFRLDGILSDAPDPPPALHHAIISRVKLLAQLDIAERRRPQDGRVRIRLDERPLDVRVSTVPTAHGESVVLRLLDRGGRPITLDELGMDADLLEHLARLVARPHGMTLVTGPTGSGKTTTLYAALQRRDARREKILTVEDPIEYQLPHIAQVPVDRAAGVTFSSALRSLLRQDPDVIMIGEMRDAETAEMAVQAAMTGHAVFSTLHTNDAAGAIPRLVDLGVPNYLVAATVEGVVAQRLVRRTCEHCRTRYTPRPDHVAALTARPEGTRELTRGAGCPRCRGTGFKGRVGIYELMMITEPLKDLIVRGATRAELRAEAESLGMRPMRDDGWRKVELGITTVEEVLRVVGA
jgi:type II secretory ATPase GspE/PulE/Tfp pilus assembly ATPase PilB-like protein